MHKKNFLLYIPSKLFKSYSLSAFAHSSHDLVGGGGGGKGRGRGTSLYVGTLCVVLDVELSCDVYKYIIYMCYDDST